MNLLDGIFCSHNKGTRIECTKERKNRLRKTEKVESRCCWRRSFDFSTVGVLHCYARKSTTSSYSDDSDSCFLDVRLFPVGRQLFSIFEASTLQTHSKDFSEVE